MSLEFARRVRNAVLSGQKVDVFVPDPKLTDNYSRGENDPHFREWVTVLGAFAGIYTTDPSLSPPEDARDDEAGLVHEGVDGDRHRDRRVVEYVRENVIYRLNGAISSPDLGEVVNFSDRENLLDWASIKSEGIEDEVISSATEETATATMTNYLTERGITTFAEKTMVTALLLTKALASDRQFRCRPKRIREIVTEQGHGLLIPLMINQDNFKNLGGKLEMEQFRYPHLQLLEKTRELISYERKGKEVTKLRWNEELYGREGGIGCPFLLAEKGKGVKKAWKMAIDTMWDPLLAPRIKERRRNK